MFLMNFRAMMPATSFAVSLIIPTGTFCTPAQRKPRWMALSMSSRPE